MFKNKPQSVEKFTKILNKNKNKLINCQKCLVRDEELFKVTTELSVKNKICLKHRGTFQKFLRANEVLVVLPQR